MNMAPSDSGGSYIRHRSMTCSALPLVDSSGRASGSESKKKHPNHGATRADPEVITRV